MFQIEQLRNPFILFWIGWKGQKTTHSPFLFEGQCQEIFRLRFFSWIIFSPAPEITFKSIISGVSKINKSRCTTLFSRWCTLSCEYLRECSKKFETAKLDYSWAWGWGKLIHENNWMKKISCHCPCCAHGTFCYFELCSICLREGLGHSKPATNPWNKQNKTTVGISTISKPYWTVFYRIKWALQVWVS